MKTIASYIWSDKTLARAYLNVELEKLYLQGTVIDIGGGKSSHYLDFIPRQEGVTITTVDEVATTDVRIDLEHDTLPFRDHTADTVLMLNLLEHIYNHGHVVREALRVTKLGGYVVGYVPFLVRYHPHPHDYFRYTKEALERILTDAGWQQVEVKECGSGPFVVTYQVFMLFLPRPIRYLLWYPVSWLNSGYLKLRPHSADRYPLGYLFRAKCIE